MGFVWQLLLLIMLTGVLPLSVIADEPIFPRARGERCVEPVDMMRRAHFEFLNHHGQQTVERGIRTGRHSLAGCIGCHAARDQNADWIPVSAPGQFCDSCHSYAAVRIDCFSCHRAVPEADRVMAN